MCKSSVRTLSFQNLQLSVVTKQCSKKRKLNPKRGQEKLVLKNLACGLRGNGSKDSELAWSARVVGFDPCFFQMLFSLAKGGRMAKNSWWDLKVVTRRNMFLLFLNEKAHQVVPSACLSTSSQPPTAAPWRASPSGPELEPCAGIRTGDRNFGRFGSTEPGSSASRNAHDPSQTPIISFFKLV